MGSHQQHGVVSPPAPTYSSIFSLLYLFVSVGFACPMSAARRQSVSPLLFPFAQRFCPPRPCYVLLHPPAQLKPFIPVHRCPPPLLFLPTLPPPVAKKPWKPIAIVCCRLPLLMKVTQWLATGASTSQRHHIMPSMARLIRWGICSRCPLFTVNSSSSSSSCSKGTCRIQVPSCA
ncbi:hypothetical protein LX32DRAFT_420911 [Colletotrichum zoysiae]|uniref:Uncharacterized protein n=1 Tax=Colletotrichum zoysiae TaxID=1216348 RepID=A0AAD9M9U7_9PEZI|nr:hypothetical protein LX32DRAFT_420911 [Colletotrichum zoysiae]